MMQPVTHFPVSARSDDENYDVRAILHQCSRESVVRFLIETKAFKAHSKVGKNYHVYISVVQGKFPTFITSFLTL